MPSTFDPLVPTGSVKLSFDYKNIQNNMQQLDTSFGINHFKFSDQTANNGKHTFVEMVNNSTIPIGLAANEGTIYAKTSSSITNLFFTPDNSAKEYQLTLSDTVNYTKFATNTNYTGTQSGGWTFLPGGLTLQYGTIVTVPNGGTATITFPRPYSTQVYSVVLTFNRTDPSSVVQTVRLSNFNSGSLTSFNFYSGSNNNSPVTWMAIGK